MHRCDCGFGPVEDTENAQRAPTGRRVEQVMIVLLLTEVSQLQLSADPTLSLKVSTSHTHLLIFAGENQKVRDWTSTQVGLVVAATFRS